MSKPCLHFGDIGLMIQSIGGGSGTKCVHPQVLDARQANLFSIDLHDSGAVLRSLLTM